MSLFASSLRSTAAHCPGATLPGGSLVVPVRTHLGYIFRQGPAGKGDTSWARTRKHLIKVNLRPIKRLHYTFDPFHERAVSIRQVMTYLSAERIQKTNPKCVYKTEVVCDRSEPTLKLEYNEGDSLLFKTANLETEEVLSLINEYVLPRVKEEVQAPVETKGAAAGKGGKAGGKKGKK